MFASTDQASVIWFGSHGAQYSPADAIFRDENLITAKLWSALMTRSNSYDSSAESMGVSRS